jgi:hypothetical protein
VVQWCACWFGDRGKNDLERKPGPRDRPNPAGPMWAACTAFETKRNACTHSRFRRSPPRMCDIPTVDPISPSQLIVSQSQLLPSFWPVIGAKRPMILALLWARAPTQRPERLQENVIERPFMHPQSQRSIPRVYLYRLRSIHLQLVCQPSYSLREKFALHRQHRALSSIIRWVANGNETLLMPFALFRFYHDKRLPQKWKCHALNH